MIEGVEFKELITNTDERGYFKELIRATDDFFKMGFGQLSHSLVYTGVIKAWHVHKYQTQWNYVVTGLLKVALHDLRSESPTFGNTMTFLFGDHQPSKIYCFPPGVAHGYKCLQGPMHIIYVTSGTYEPAENLRISHDDKNIGYNWLKLEIK